MVRNRKLLIEQLLAVHLFTALHSNPSTSIFLRISCLQSTSVTVICFYDFCTGIAALCGRTLICWLAFGFWEIRWVFNRHLTRTASIFQPPQVSLDKEWLHFRFWLTATGPFMRSVTSRETRAAREVRFPISCFRLMRTGEGIRRLLIIRVPISSAAGKMYFL